MADPEGGARVVPTYSIHVHVANYTVKNLNSSVVISVAKGHYMQLK